MLIKNTRKIIAIAFILTIANSKMQGYALDKNFNPAETSGNFPINELNFQLENNNQNKPQAYPYFQDNKLDDIVQKLDNMKVDVEKDYNTVQSQLDDVNKRLEKTKQEQKDTKKQLKTIKKELKTIDSVKNKIRNNLRRKNNFRI